MLMSQVKPILLMVTSQDWGGAQAYVFNLALEMKSQGLPVIICAGHAPTRDDSLGQKCASAQIEFLNLKHMARDINPINNLLALFELIKLFRRVQPRAIQLNSSMMGAIGSLAGYLTKVPRIVYTAHGWVFNEQLPNWKKTLYIWIEKISARLKHVIICLHDQDLELAKKHGIKPRQKILVIPNGIDAITFEKNLAGREEACRTLSEIAASFVELIPRNDMVDGLSASTPPPYKGRGPHGALRPTPPHLRRGTTDHPDVRRYGRERTLWTLSTRCTLIGTIANAYPPKNLLWYLEVCQAVHAKNPDIRFVIAGDGPQMDELQAKHQELEQADYVLLTGRLDPASIYQAFDIFVLPSSKEGMPITILEAMAAKLPIIATDVGACRLMLEPDAGLIVPPNDLSALTQAILDLTADAEKRQKLGHQAYQKVTQNFTWQNTADQTIKELL